jgi:transmembrane sensor
MAERATSHEIDQQAADWVAKLDRGALTGGDERAYQEWLGGDPRHRGAMLKANALAMLSESARALGDQSVAANPAPVVDHGRKVTSRRRLLAWSGAGGLAAASTVLLGFGATSAQAITTGLGEVRRVTLDDGSTVMLNTDTSVRVRYTRSARSLELVYGEAYFMILTDAARPFLVEAGRQPLRTAGAAFRVRRLDHDPIDVLVDRGLVTLMAQRPVRMASQTHMVVPLSGDTAPPVPRTISSDYVSRELAWRDGKIAFEGDRLDQAAAEFARYSPTRIKIMDPALAGETVTGLFAASDPLGFGRAVESAFGARMQQRGGTLLLTRRAQST